jgi:SAM-dependent methyltransferase
MAASPGPLRRDLFDGISELYDRARPGYPERLVEDLIFLADIGPRSRVLEIGPGTGQLSVPLAKCGASLCAVERGPKLAEVARRKLSRFERADVVVADFDTWEPTPGSFDVVVAATAFHWLDASTRVRNCARVLRPGGAMAIVQTRWSIAVGEDAFFAASQACYSRWTPNHDPAFRQATMEDASPPCADVSGPGFANVVHRRYVCATQYDAAAYCELLSTFSDVLTLEDGSRAGFLACISSLIDSEFGGKIVRHHLYDLCVARRAV